jgi:hypothetical protein
MSAHNAPRALCSRVLGADDAPFGAIMGQRGDARARGTGSSRGVTTVAASASETPSRCARAVRERAGASPRVRKAVRRVGRRTCIHWWALLWPIPHKRPCTTWRAEVLRETRMKNRRSSGVAQGQCLYTGHRRAVQGFPSSRHARICAWSAASKDGMRSGNSSRVTLVTSQNFAGRACTSVHRTRAICDASFQGRHCIL